MLVAAMAPLHFVNRLFVLDGAGQQRQEHEASHVKPQHGNSLVIWGFVELSLVSP